MEALHKPESGRKLVKRAIASAAAFGCHAVQISGAVFNDAGKWMFAISAAALRTEAVKGLNRAIEREDGSVLLCPTRSSCAQQIAVGTDNELTTRTRTVDAIKIRNIRE
jgi:hypothetical protein